MGGGEGTSTARELDQTPTWAVASVCAVIIVISIILEKVLHLVGEVSMIITWKRISYILPFLIRLLSIITNDFYFFFFFNS